MANTTFSIPRFSGARYGSEDNLIQSGYAAEAVNIDTSDGALQSLTGAYPFPDIIDDEGIVLNPRLMFTSGLFYNTRMFCITPVGLAEINLRNDGKWHASIGFAPDNETEEELYLEAAAASRILQTSIDGIEVVIALSNDVSELPANRPIIIGLGNLTEPYYIRRFGSGQFLTSDAITVVLTDSQNKITGVRVARVMTDEEVARCIYAGVYIMEHAYDELDYTAAYVSDCQTYETYTEITFRDALSAGSVSVGDYVKIRGGLSDRPVAFMQMFYGRLFAAGDSYHPNRLYWSCLPGDGRTIEDWSADDASPDTGGGYIDVGSFSDPISALFVYQSQLLIWAGTSLYRLYGATPSQYTLELVCQGIGDKTYINDSIMQDRIADVRGVPYFLIDDGLFYYDGSGLSRVDTDDSVRFFLQRYATQNVPTYPKDLSAEISGVYGAFFWRDSIYFTLSKYEKLMRLGGRPTPGTNKSVIARYDFRSGSFSLMYGTPFMNAFRRGLLVANYNLDKLFLYLDDFNYVKNGALLGDGWEQLYRVLPTNESGCITAPIDAAWESNDLTFGEPSQNKRLRRVGIDVTGSIRVIVKTSQGSVFEQDCPAADVSMRRFLWLSVDMPYESSFRIRFESIDGQPFRIHNGADFSIETYTRN